MEMTDYWIWQYKLRFAYWIHDGNPKRPHVQLSSELHSDGFFNSRLVTKDVKLLRHASFDLLTLFTEHGGRPDSIKGVVGPQKGATKLAESLRNAIVEVTRDPEVFWVSPAKHESGGCKTMVFMDEELAQFRGSSIMLCEDVLTTGGSVYLTSTAVYEAGGITLPYILVLVNRSGFTHIKGKKVIALIDQHMPTWTPDECPLCKQGSEAVRPKDNWDRLNAEY